MRVKSSLGAVALAFGLLSASAGTGAAGPVVDHPDVDGLRTFQDVATGLVWVDLNNYFNLSYNDMKADVEAKGFKVATVDEVHGLLDSLPLDSGEWFGYTTIMGSAPFRDLIWGAYVPEIPDVVSWAFAFSDYTSWDFATNTGTGLDEVPNGNTGNADMNIWAYYAPAAAVPEPSTLAGAALAGLLGLAVARRRKSA